MKIVIILMLGFLFLLSLSSLAYSRAIQTTNNKSKLDNTFTIRNLSITNNLEEDNYKIARAIYDASKHKTEIKSHKNPIILNNPLGKNYNVLENISLHNIKKHRYKRKTVKKNKQVYSDIETLTIKYSLWAKKCFHQLGIIRRLFYSYDLNSDNTTIGIIKPSTFHNNFDHDKCLFTHISKNQKVIIEKVIFRILEIRNRVLENAFDIFCMTSSKNLRCSRLEKSNFFEIFYIKVLANRIYKLNAVDICIVRLFEALIISLQTHSSCTISCSLSNKKSENSFIALTLLRQVTNLKDKLKNKFNKEELKKKNTLSIQKEDRIFLSLKGNELKNQILELSIIAEKLKKLSIFKADYFIVLKCIVMVYMMFINFLFGN